MAYTNSSLVSYTKLSPNHSGQRTHSIDRITPHCVVGQCSVETLGNIFLPVSKQASCNYGIGEDGRIGMYVEEKNRSWCSSSNANDQRAITIECASDTAEPYAFKDVVYQKLITLCADICKRNGKKKLLWLGDKDKTLSYEPKSYKCDGLCDTCKFRCIPKDAPQHLSIDTEMENACENGVSRTSFLADNRLTTEIDIDSLILNGLLSELQASDPESYEILIAIADGLSERAGAERLQMPRNTFVYKRNQLLKRLKEKF